MDEDPDITYTFFRTRWVQIQVGKYAAYFINII